jgi:major membrane immunogen (membrane-anchored lipoprotein)
MKIIATGVALAATLLIAVAPAPAVAHGDHAPKHGGVVRETKEFVVETAIKDGKATVYLYDHSDKPAQTKGAEGTITVGRKDKAKSFKLKAGEGASNVLVATDLPIVPKGETVAVDVTVGGQSIAKVRYMAK